MNSPQQDGVDSPDSGPSDDELRNALGRVIASDGFVAAPRLQQFLTYIVEEAIAGRGANINGKTIAVDVYGRSADDVESGHNLVRVEARRLRRRLSEYYARSGADDPWKIHVDLGGYTPRFEPATAAEPKSRRGATLLPRPQIFVAAIVALLAALVVGTTFDWGSGGSETSSSADGARRTAYRDRSMQALQAVNLAEQTRGMLFPLLDLKRQELALEMFRHAIDLDPGLHYGYSGAAQVLATLALMTPDRVAAEGFRQDAILMAEKALDLGPSEAWAQAANGLVLAVTGDLDRAISSASRAIELAPEDGHILDLVGLTAIVANDPQFAANVSNPERPRSGVGRLGANNIWGISQYMLGNHRMVIDIFSATPESGEPISLGTIVFLAAAYDHVGDPDKARRAVAELNATWPDYPVEHVFTRIFPNSPDIGHDILERLAKHGYPESTSRPGID